MTDAPDRILINRLRDEAFNPRNNLAVQVECIRAADAIADLQTENQRLREALRPFGDAADYAIEAVSKTTTLGVLGSLAPYFVSWQDFKRARAALRSTRELEAMKDLDV